jgi:hypothetical protein
LERPLTRYGVKENARSAAMFATSRPDCRSVVSSDQNPAAVAGTDAGGRWRFSFAVGERHHPNVPLSVVRSVGRAVEAPMRSHMFFKRYRCGFRSTLCIFSEPTEVDVLLFRDARNCQSDDSLSVQTCGSREPISQLASDLTAMLPMHKRLFCHRCDMTVNPSKYD